MTDAGNTGSHQGGNPAPLSVSPGAAAAFTEALPRLLSMVNDKFAIESRVLGGHGPADLDLIGDAHRHFGDMLRAIYEFDLADHALGEFGWYVSSLSPRGFDEEYFRKMLEAWMIAIHAEIKPPESSELSRLLEYFCRNVHNLYSEPAVEAGDLGPEVEHFLGLLLEKRRRPAARYALEMAERLGSTGRVYTGLLLPAMSRIGLLWQTGKISVADEHAATEIGRYVIFRIIDSQPVKEPLGTRAVVACVPGEEHDIGAQIAGGYLEAAGWEVIFLGRSAPEEEILKVLASHRPRLAVLSVNMLARLPAAVRLFRKIRAGFGEVRVIAGGRAAGAARKVLEAEVDAVVLSLEGLAGEAERLVTGNA
jgi:methanogenic corrinoid protein MtbC1